MAHSAQWYNLEYLTLDILAEDNPVRTLVVDILSGKRKRIHSIE